jgi:hypothetical protein
MMLLVVMYLDSLTQDLSNKLQFDEIGLDRAGSSKNFTVFICLLAPFPIAFGALFTVAAPSAPVCLEHVEHASSRPWV